MAFKESPRTNDINYKYDLIKDDLLVEELQYYHQKGNTTRLIKNDLIIQESYHDQKRKIPRTHTFTINNIKNHLYEEMINRNFSGDKINSYYRTRQWLLKNHPELMI